MEYKYIWRGRKYMHCPWFWKSKTVWYGLELSVVLNKNCGDGWELSGNGFLWGVVNNWYVCNAESVCQAEVLRITEFLWGLKWKKGIIKGRKISGSFGEKVPQRHLIKTSLLNRMDIQMKLKRRKIVFCEWSLPPYHLPQPTENGIRRRKNIFITKGEKQVPYHITSSWQCCGLRNSGWWIESALETSSYNYSRNPER